MTSTSDTITRPKRGNGITTPSRRGGSGRVLTDVIVDLGYVDRGTMDLAIDRGTENGSAPERLLIQDRTGILNRDLPGGRNIMWSSDYPHSETTFPNSREIILRDFEGIPEDDIRDIICNNAKRLYRLD